MRNHSLFPSSVVGKSNQVNKILTKETLTTDWSSVNTSVTVAVNRNRELEIKNKGKYVNKIT